MATDTNGGGDLTLQDSTTEALAVQPLAAARPGGFRGFVGRMFGSAVSGAVGTAAGMATVDVLQPQLQPLVNREWSKHKERPLSAVDAAALVERGEFTMDEAISEGALTGYDSRRMVLLDRLAGLAPAPEQLLTAFRRKIIDEARLHKGLIQGNVRSEWADMFEQMGNAIPSVSQMVHFATRGVYGGGSELEGTPAEMPDGFPADAQRNGLTAADAVKYWQAHWRLPSPEQLYRMLWRGHIDEATLNGALRANDYPQFWRPKLAAIAHNVPGRIDLRRMLAAGVIDEARVLRGYKEMGYTPEDAAILTQFAVELAKPQPEGATVKVDWVARARSSAFADIHLAQKKGNLTQGEAAGRLGAIGVPDEAAAAAARLWQIANG